MKTIVNLKKPYKTELNLTLCCVPTIQQGTVALLDPAPARDTKKQL